MQGNTCCWCGIETTNELGPRQGTVEHIIPRSKGGTSNISNLRIACAACNSHRGDKDIGQPLPLNLPDEIMQVVSVVEAFCRCVKDINEIVNHPLGFWCIQVQKGKFDSILDAVLSTPENARQRRYAEYLTLSQNES